MERSQRPEPERHGSEALQLIGSFISTFFVTVLVIIAAFLVIVRLTGCYLFTIESASMTPAYPVNSVVLVRPVEFSDLAVGDVVTYVLNESGTLVTHRVISINTAGRTVTTQGDANDSPDTSAVLADNIVGRVVMSFPGLGVVLRVLTEEDNRPFVIAAIVILLGASFLWDLQKRRRSRRISAAESDFAEEPGDSGDWLSDGESDGAGDRPAGTDGEWYMDGPDGVPPRGRQEPYGYKERDGESFPGERTAHERETHFGEEFREDFFDESEFQDDDV